MLLWGLAGLPPSGATRARTATLIVESREAPASHRERGDRVVFDYRGFDTMGEEFILFVARVCRRDAAARDARATDVADIVDAVRSDATRAARRLAAVGVCS